jgi:parallel beta-helix repeat protein
VTSTFAGFMSYVRIDDHHENGRLTELCSRLAGEVRMQLGERFSIFQDRNDVSWGQQWHQRIDGVIDATTFLFPIITPGFFKSPGCREEVERFLKRENQLGRSDLILPIYYLNCPAMGDETLRDGDSIAHTIAARQYADWRELRFEPFTTPAVGKTLAALAGQIVRALEHVERELSPASKIASKRGSDDQRAGGNESGRDRASVSVGGPQRLGEGKKEPPTLIVDALHRGDHSSLTAALKAAKSGYRILVRPGLYREGIVIDKAIEIIGDGELGDVVIEASDKPVIRFGANMGRVVNLTLRQMGGGESYGVDISQGRLDLEGCDITSASLTCVAIRGGADPRLRRNRIHSGKEGGVFVYANGLGTLEDNEIFGNAMSGVEIKSGGNPTLRRNRIHDGKQGGVLVHENGLGILEDNEIFTNGLAGVEVRSGGNPTLRRNRIHGGKQCGVLVSANGLGALEDNEIFANAHVGVEIKSGGNPTLRRNVISKNSYEAVWIHEGGRGEITDNDLRGNTGGAFDISEDCKTAVRADRNQK